jgi:DNA-directed RNA polymerase subunit RPC12/RpoP
MNESKKCALCGKELIYDFEIEDGICEECSMNLKKN